MFKKNIILLLILCSITLSTSYWSVSKFREYNKVISIDINSYKKMVFMPFKNDVYAPFCYRLLTPVVVNLFQNIPYPQLLGNVLNLEGKDNVETGFSIVNIIFTMLTSIILYYFFMNNNIQEYYSFLGSIFYLTSYYVVTWNYLPLVDAAGHFFLALGLYSIISSRYKTLAFAVLIGFWAKETTLLLIFAALLWDHKDRLLHYSILPGTILYITARVFVFSNVAYFESSFQSYVELFLSHYTSLSYYFDVFIKSFFVFLPLSIISIYRFRHTYPRPMQRLLWLIIPIYGQTFIATDGGRLVFYAFPIIFYTVVYYLQEYFSESSVKLNN